MTLESLTTATEEGTARDEYRTPPEIFDGLRCEFDLDVAAPIYGPNYVPSSYVCDRDNCGLDADWTHGFGFRTFVWMNPPFGTRNGVVKWLDKFFDHGHGIGLVPALTSSGWFHEWMPKSSSMFFPRGKTKFIRPDGTIANSPPTGIVLFSAGEQGRSVLRDCSLEGMWWPR